MHSFHMRYGTLLSTHRLQSYRSYKALNVFPLVWEEVDGREATTYLIERAPRPKAVLLVPIILMFQHS